MSSDLICREIILQPNRVSERQRERDRRTQGQREREKDSMIHKADGNKLVFLAEKNPFCDCSDLKKCLKLK